MLTQFLHAEPFALLLGYPPHHHHPVAAGARSSPSRPWETRTVLSHAVNTRLTFIVIIDLQRDAVQEFFRGSLSKNPLYSTDIVPRAAAGGGSSGGGGGGAASAAVAAGAGSASSTIGGAAEATMRDMRDKIATDLDMTEAVRLVFVCSIASLCVRLFGWSKGWLIVRVICVFVFLWGGAACISCHTILLRVLVASVHVFVQYDMYAPAYVRS